MFVAAPRAASGCKANAWFPEPLEFASNPLDEAVDHPLFAGAVERNGKLVAVDMRPVAVAELLGEHAIANAERRHGSSRFCDELAFDGQRQAALRCLLARC